MEVGAARRVDHRNSVRKELFYTHEKVVELSNKIEPLRNGIAMVSSAASSKFEKRDLDRAQGAGLDSIFVLDCSRSMGDKLDSSSKSSKLDLCKTAFVSAFSRAFENNCPDRVGLLAVSTNILAKPVISEVMPFWEISGKDGQAKTVPIEDIVAIKCQGGTALYSAISYATRILVSKKKSKMAVQQIVLVTDSKNNTAEQPMKVLAEAAKHQIKIHVIDLGNKKVQDSLRMISDATGGQFAFVSNASELQNSLFAAFTLPVEEEKEPTSSARVLFPGAYGDPSRPPVVPKRKRAETVEEIRASIEQIKKELENITQSLKSGGTNQMQFTEKYSILQFDLQELRQSIREQRSKLNREMSEYALAKDRVPDNNSLNRETNERLLELDKQIEILKQSAAFVS
jgi:Mg-chelatase subunit ChlD